MKKEELEEAIKILKEPVTISCENYYYFKQEDYDKLKHAYEIAQSVIEYIEILLRGDNYEEESI